MTAEAGLPEAPPSTSVVVVSRGRPALLRLAVLSLSQQDHPAMEVVVVCDDAGEVALSDLPFRDRLKVSLFNDANISAARNIGIGRAAGEVVAFMDDDAVAEPTWARRLSAPFNRREVVAATGFVRGRNGLSWQSRASSVGPSGAELPLSVPEDAPSLHRAAPGWAVKTVGTNCAFRRSTLIGMDGFDPNYRYFLDETDLNMRLALASAMTAVVPGAQVIHGYAANANRRADRAPTDLTEIGASVALFLEAHCHASDRSRAVARFREEQRRRALRHLVTGALEPRDIGRLLTQFDNGLRAGPQRDEDPPVFGSLPAFRPLNPGAGPTRHNLIARRRGFAGRARREAAESLDPATVVTLLLMSPTARPHRVGFSEPGLWIQTGGQFGRSLREGPRFRLASFRRRATAERLRIDQCRKPSV